ncbi:MAG: response regulator [Chloroflexi bacterium]|nr:response regulator [Chloroflexota bacterium]
MGKPKVLVADGSMFMRTMLKSQLEALNLDVVATAKNKEETVSKCQEAEPDIVLIDVSIAETDDFGVVRTIKECAGSCCIIVMIPEQTNLPEVVVETVKAGASGYIKKPISPQDLKGRISGVLGR